MWINIINKFKTLYENSIKRIMPKGQKQATGIDGKWVKYEQGSDYHLLRDSLQGYYTGWLAAIEENFAKDQLENGDFYVYYTYGENGEAKIPRIAIRMDGTDEIIEIRGIADRQNIEEEMVPILEKKLEEFPNRDRYRKKEYDMQLLTTIDSKVQKGYDLSLEELKFLYEIDYEIEGFGYKRDPRIEEIKSKRDQVKDLNYIFTYVKEIKGDLYLDYLTSAEGLILPDKVGGSINFLHLTNARGLVLPKEIGGDLWFGCLTSAEGLILPDKVGGDLWFGGLTSAKGLVLPKEVGGALSLRYLTSAEGLNLPEIIGEYLNLRGLTSAEGLILPANFDIKNLIAPDFIKEEIMNHPEKHFRNQEESLILNAKTLKGKHFAGGAEELLRNLSEDAEELETEYKGKHFR